VTLWQRAKGPALRPRGRKSEEQEWKPREKGEGPLRPRREGGRGEGPLRPRREERGRRAPAPGGSRKGGGPLRPRREEKREKGPLRPRREEGRGKGPREKEATAREGGGGGWLPSYPRCFRCCCGCWCCYLDSCCPANATNTHRVEFPRPFCSDECVQRTTSVPPGPSHLRRAPLDVPFVVCDPNDDMLEGSGRLVGWLVEMRSR
jgi:hypothetical protein